MPEWNLTFTMKWHINFMYYHSRLEILHVQCHNAAPWSASKLTVKQLSQLKHALSSIFFLRFKKLFSTRKIFLDTPEKLVEKNAVAQKLDKTKNALRAQLRIKLSWISVLVIMQLFQTRALRTTQTILPVCYCTWQKLAAHWTDSMKSKIRGIYNEMIFHSGSSNAFNSRGSPLPPVPSLKTLVQAQCTSRSGGLQHWAFHYHLCCLHWSQLSQNIIPAGMDTSVPWCKSHPLLYLKILIIVSLSN